MTAEHTPVVARPRSVRPRVAGVDGGVIRLGTDSTPGLPNLLVVESTTDPQQVDEDEYGQAWVELDRAGVRELRDELSAWLDRTGF